MVHITESDLKTSPEVSDATILTFNYHHKAVGEISCLHLSLSEVITLTFCGVRLHSDKSCRVL